MGGTAGDLVTAIIDGKDAQLDGSKIFISPFRSKLKKPHLFNNPEEADNYINEMSGTYKSLPSHCLDHHIDLKHDFISITVDDLETATWAAQRFKDLHLPHVWEEVMNYSNITTVEEYANLLLIYSSVVTQHTDKIIRLQDILDGKLLDILEEFQIQPHNPQLYRMWLEQR